MGQDHVSRSRQAEEGEDEGSNTSVNATLGDVIAERFNRRDLLKGALAVTAISATVSPLALAERAEAQGAKPTFDFKEVAAGIDERHHIAEGYDADILIRWGDPIFADALAVRSARADGRQAAASVRLQQRLSRLFPDRRFEPRPSRRQP